ncbi:hypothetical protein [Longirhabdus pacifica]|uniref:hypothetical protein n=1 Tax=Longirhabdus pacifica TaxID=2305227 RepID=UPI0010087855|nr:hypothetical protein [Longirhabdus pacifica]
MIRHHRVRRVVFRSNPGTSSPLGCPCACTSSGCTGSCFCWFPILDLCAQAVSVSNADITVTTKKNGQQRLNYKPSKHVQYSVISANKKGIFKITTFIYAIKNTNKRRAFAQVVSGRGKRRRLENRTILFDTNGKVKGLK